MNGIVSGNIHFAHLFKLCFLCISNFSCEIDEPKFGIKFNLDELFSIKVGSFLLWEF